MNHSYKYRTAFGVWINDMKNKPMPRKEWPFVVLDDDAEYDIKKCLELQQRAEFNILDAAGLFVSYSWPLEVEKAVDEGRRQRLQRIFKEAHNVGIKVISTLGVYSWGFDEIIKNNPGVQGPNPHAMCGSSEDSWNWMKKVLDYILLNFNIDGFHLESSDQGRCTCPSCSKMGDIEYHSKINKKVAEYVRSRWPDKILMVNMCGYTKWGGKIPKEEFRYLQELGKCIDFLIDNGNGDHFIEEELRPEFIKNLDCCFGTSGGLWVYPPQRWDRQRWFLPYAQRTGKHIKRLYTDGGRAIEYYMGPTLNPGVEMNILAGGLQLSNAARDMDDILNEAIEILYKPVDSKTCRRLVGIFKRAEDAYFENRIIPSDMLGRSPFSENGELKMWRELGITHLFGTSPGPATYLSDYGSDGKQMMNSKGRNAYKDELLALLDEIEAIEGGVKEIERLDRIRLCITNVLADIETIEWTISPKFI